MSRNRIESMRTRRHLGALVAALLWLGPWAADAEVYPLSPDGGDLIGRVDYVSALHEDTLIDIARRTSVGQLEINMANPKVDRWLPGDGTRVVIPHRYILPNAPHAGIVVNIPEMRLYYFPVQYATIVHKKYGPAPKVKGAKGAKGKAAAPKQVVIATTTEMGEPIGRASEVITYPVSMGRMDWRTPLGKTRIVQKVKDPTWTPPESIKREHAKKGDFLPNVVPAGPNNPLGPFAMKLGVSGYLIHGTDRGDPAKPFGIGERVTHGCMRMYNEDVTKLYPEVSVGTPVYLVNQPVKLGWQGGELYMEVSWPLDEDAGIPVKWGDDALDDSDMSDEEIKAIRAKKKVMLSAYLSKVANNLIEKENAKHAILVDKAAIRNAVESPTGIPVSIGKEAPPPAIEAAPGEYPPPGQSGSGQYPAPQPTPARIPPADPYGQPPASNPYGAGHSAPTQYPSGQYDPDPYAQPPAAIPQGYGTEPSTPRQSPPARDESDPYAQPPASIPYGAGQGTTERNSSEQYGSDPYAPSPYATNPEPAGRPVAEPYEPRHSSSAPSPAPDPYAPDDEEEEEAPAN